MIKYLLILILLPCVVFSAWPDMDFPDADDTITITEEMLPYDCVRDSTIYMLAGNLVAADTGIRIKEVSWVKLVGSGDTLTFDHNSAGGCVGLHLWDCDSVIVESLTVTQYRTVAPVSNGSYGGSDCEGAIRVFRGKVIQINECNAHVTGHSSHCVTSPEYEGTEGLLINGGNYTSFSNSFDNRMDNDGAAIILYGSGAENDLAQDYHHYVTNITMDSGLFTGILAGGKSIVTHNNITIDSHNEKPTTSWANAHAIGTETEYGPPVGAWAGSRFDSNTIRSGTTHSGARGIYLDYSVGTVSDSISVAYNDIQLSHGYTTEADAARGIRIRWGNFYLRVHHNNIILTCNGADSTYGIGNEAHGLWFGALGEESSAIGCHNYFYNNHIEVTFSDTTQQYPDYRTCAFGFEQAQSIDSVHLFNNDNRSWGNYFKCNVHPAIIEVFNTSYNNRGYLTSVSDTFDWSGEHFPTQGGEGQKTGPNYTGIIKFGTGDQVQDSTTNNHIIDPIFINGDPTDFVWGTNTPYARATVLRRVNVNVIGENDLPVANAIVRIWNSYGDSTVVEEAVGTGLSDVSGDFFDTLNIYYKEWDSSISDSNSYNTFRIKALKDDNSASVVVTLSSDGSMPDEIDITLEGAIGVIGGFNSKGGIFLGGHF